MHRSKNALLLFFCFYSIMSLGQIKLDSIEQVLIKKNEYFNLQREVIHLHTNKTIYLTDDAIWFKAYIVDHLNHKPFTVTKNLYLTLYNENGDKIDHKLYLVSNGFADGAFMIPKNLDTGNYILMASTAHQDNFKEDERYYQKITIQNVSQPILTQTVEEKQKSYDIQILPEGGNLLAGVINTCGVKIIDQQGIGVKQVTSKLFAQSATEPITEFKLNKFGMGKFSFNPSPNENYYIISNVGNQQIKTEVPKQQPRGVLVQTSFHPTKPILVVELSTNKTTLPTIKNKKFHILIHQYQKTTGLSASFTDETNIIKLAIPLKDLPYGVNTISLFDENHNPISERLVFNDAPNKLIASERIKSRVIGDSILTSFRLKSEGAIVDSASLSVSILPAETISNTNNNSIINSIYLQPFIHSHVENPAYYFQNVTKRKQYDLDVLLLTQGWSKYDWNTIFRKNTLPQIEHENGITLKGSINKVMTPNTNLLITSQENQFTDILIPEKDSPLRNFILKNLVLKDSTKVQFVINDKKDQTSDANVKASITSFQPLGFSPKVSEIGAKTYFTKETNNVISVTDPIKKEKLFKTDEKLEEVVIFVKKNPKRKTNDGITLSGNNRLYLDDRERAAQVLLKRYLTSRNYVIVPGPDIEGHQYIITKRIKDEIVAFKFFINNIRTTPFPEKLLDMRLENVEDIYILENDIFVYATTPVTDEKPINSFLVNNGYQSKQKFYTPKYQSYDNLFFKQYGVLGWIPAVKRNINNEYEFSFENTSTQEAKLFIEGIDKNGNLISEIKVIQI